MRASRRRALTLVEVVAGLTLLATLATSMLLALGAHRRQVRAAEFRIAAVELADQLLTEWYVTGNDPPRNTSGAVAVGEDVWRWRTLELRQSAGVTLPARIVRLEVRAPHHRSRTQPTLAVEVMVASE